MKKIIKVLFAAIFLISMLQSCKKTNGGNGNNLPAPVNTIISQAIIDSMKKWGMTINEGTTPPSLKGAYLMHPNICTFDNSGDNYTGLTFTDYKYKFSNQNNSAFTIRVDYIDAPSYSDSGADVQATYISGSGNAFTIFAQVTGVASGINYTTLELYSGTIEADGIKNFQTAIYLKSKDDDPYGRLMSAGSSRIFYDSDYLSDSTSTYAVFPLQRGGTTDNNVMPGMMQSRTNAAGRNN